MKWFWQRKKKVSLQAYEGKNVFLYEETSSPYESILIRAVVKEGRLCVEDAELDHDSFGWSRRVYQFDMRNTKKLFALLMEQGDDPYAVMSSMIDYNTRMRKIKEMCKQNGIEYKDTLYY